MMNDLSKLRNWQTISVSPENLTGEKGKGGACVVHGRSYG